jgi:hypothetical protein
MTIKEKTKYLLTNIGFLMNYIISRLLDGFVKKCVMIFTVSNAIAPKAEL